MKILRFNVNNRVYYNLYDYLYNYNICRIGYDIHHWEFSKADIEYTIWKGER